MVVGTAQAGLPRARRRALAPGRVRAAAEDGETSDGRYPKNGELHRFVPTLWMNYNDVVLTAGTFQVLSASRRCTNLHAYIRRRPPGAGPVERRRILPLGEARICLEGREFIRM